MAIGTRGKTKSKAKTKAKARTMSKSMKSVRSVDDFTFEKKPLYSPADIARILDVSDQTVLDWIHSERLFAAQIGPRLFRIPLASFMQFLGVPPQVRWTHRRNVVVDASEDAELDRAES